MAKSYPEYNFELDLAVLEAMKPYGPGGIFSFLKERAGGRPKAGDFREAGEIAGAAAVEAGQKYPDRTAEMIEMASGKTGLQFPPVFQRHLEIWLLCTGLFKKWQLKQSTTGGMVYEVGQCALKEESGREWPGITGSDCGGYCTGALERMAAKLGLAIGVKREEDSSTGVCRFTITPV